MTGFLTALQSIDPVAARIGPFTVHWYGLSYIVGIAICSALMYYFAKRWGLSLTPDEFLTAILCGTIGILAGGRVFYCLVYGGSYFWLHPWRILAVYEGGMSFHGSLIGGILAGIVAARFTKIRFLTLLELGFIGAPIGLGIGRVTNFINGELWGRVTEVPWGVVFAGAGPFPRHPSQLYEAFMEGVLLAAIMIAVAMRLPPPRPGTVLGTFLTGYGTFRIIGEFFRQPDAQLGFIAGDWLTMGILLSSAMVVAGIALLIVSNARDKADTSMSVRE